MASTVPAKSSLHNFALPLLKWSNNLPRGGRGGGDGEEGLGRGRVKRNVRKFFDEEVEKSEKLKVLGSDHRENLDSSEDKGRDKRNVKKSKVLGSDHWVNLNSSVDKGRVKRNVKKGLVNDDEKVEKSEKSKVLGSDHGVDLNSRVDKGRVKRNVKNGLENDDEKVEKSKVLVSDHGVDLDSSVDKGRVKKRNVKRGLENDDETVGKSEKLKVLGSDYGVDMDGSDDKVNEKEPKSRILIKIPASMRNSGNDKVKEEEKEENQVMIDEQRLWNLRPRRSVKKKSNGDDGVGLKNGVGGGGLVQEKKKDQLQEGNSENGTARGRVEKEKEKKVQFSMSLTRLEIAEDIYSFTGSKPSRRPKKRAKVVQKNLDVSTFFPGSKFVL